MCWSYSRYTPRSVTQISRLHIGFRVPMVIPPSEGLVYRLLFAHTAMPVSRLCGALVSYKSDFEELKRKVRTRCLPFALFPLPWSLDRNSFQDPFVHACRRLSRKISRHRARSSIPISGTLRWPCGDRGCSRLPRTPPRASPASRRPSAYRSAHHPSQLSCMATDTHTVGNDTPVQWSSN